MSLEYIPIPDAPVSVHDKGRGKWQLIVKEFVASGRPSARIAKDVENAPSVAVCVRHAINSLGMKKKVRVAMRGDDVYLAVAIPELEP